MLMVQRLPNPALVTDSMSSGGEPHERLSMTAPGSEPISPMPQPFEVLSLGVNTPFPQDTDASPIPVSNQKDRYSTGDVPRNGDLWKTTTTTGQSYEGTSYGDDAGRLT